VKNTSWYLAHLWVIVLQLITFLPYMIASIRFYKYKDHFVRWLAIGIALDVFLAVAASTGSLPKMSQNDTAPWNSLLFVAHISLAGIGMFGFIALFIFLLAKGTNRHYPRLRKFQLRFLLSCWIIGVMIALANFGIKMIFNVRLYDLL